jgi:hypothetical protein
MYWEFACGPVADIATDLLGPNVRPCMHSGSGVLAVWLAPLGSGTLVCTPGVVPLYVRQRVGPLQIHFGHGVVAEVSPLQAQFQVDGWGRRGQMAVRLAPERSSTVYAIGCTSADESIKQWQRKHSKNS